jgi:predicted TIM-barrel fold metal-dependent hydrolase
MDIDGIQAQLCFPQFPRFAGTRFLEAKDKKLGLLCVQAYNDWMLDEWCATAPDRFIPLCILPLWDPALAAAEIERVGAKGCKSIAFPENVSALGLPSIHTGQWDPVFAAAQDARLPLCTHIGTSGALPQPSPDSHMVVGHVLVGHNSMAWVVDLVFSDILGRFPGTRIALSEGGAGWAPYLIERMEYQWARSRVWLNRSTPPGETFRRHFWTCIIKDATAIKLRHEIGINNLMVETDFPHSDSNWPHSRKVISEMLADVPDDECRLIAGGNARALFNFF